METWITRTAQSRCRRQVVAWLIAGACGLLLVLSQQRYVRNFVMGPYTFTATDLDAVRDVSSTPRYFVRVTGSKAIDVGVEQITVRTRNNVETGREISARYYALAVGDKLLLCKSRRGAVTTLEGSLEPTPADLLAHVFRNSETVSERRLYPFILDDASFRVGGQAAIGALLFFLAVFAWKGLPALNRLRNPMAHPAVARAARWGDPAGVAAAAEADVCAPRFRSATDWKVGDLYLVHTSFFGFDILRLQDLLWAYKKVTKHSVNAIPTRRTYEAVLRCYGGAASIQGNEQTVDAVLQFAAGRAPWAVFGFSDERSKLFDKDNAAFCALVEQRKRERAQPAARARA